MLSTDLKSTHSDLSPKSAIILSVREQVFMIWEQEVRHGIVGAENIAHPILLDTLPLFYGNIVEALTPNFPRENAASGSTAAAGHGGERARTTEYSAVEVVHEYQILRNVFLKVCRQNSIEFDEDEMRIISQSFDQAIREAIEEFTIIQDEFRTRIAGALTHDMRSPLSIMVGAAQLLYVSTDEKTQRLARKIHENGMRLEAMFKEQLDVLHRVPSDRINVSQWDAFALAKEVCEQTNEVNSVVCNATGRNTIVWWDKDLVRRAVENLIGNAIKYGDKTEIQINVMATHGRAIISVHNSGNPILEHQQKEIFRYLNRGDASDKPGWGIGLTFVQSVAVRHGGTVVLDSSEATGTTFTMDIPCDSREHLAV